MPTLFEKLIAAGLPVESASESGSVLLLPGMVMNNVQWRLLNDICREHQYPNEFAKEKLAQGRKDNAYAKAAENAVILKDKTPEEAVAYIEANVNGTADIKVMLEELAWLVLALRDETWPTLKDEV